jgi:peptidoglycan/LPS O-acetylase OafA/YrhL
MRVITLDAVRATAAFAVAIPHFFMAKNVLVQSSEHISIVAVEVFFVLSGFVLAPQLLFCVRKDTYRNTRVFYVRRWIRTIPPFLFALVLVSSLYHEFLSVYFFRYFTFVRNLFAYSEDNDYFFPAWSLAVEEWFYLLFPIVLLLRKDRSPIYTACFFVAALGVLKLLLLLLYPDAVAHLRRVTMLRLDAIAMGFLLYAAVSKPRPGSSGTAQAVGFAGLLIFGTFVGAILDSISAAPATWKEMVFSYAAPLFGCSIIALAYSFRSEGQKDGIATKLAIYGGRISYSVYLFHLPFVLLVTAHVHLPSEWQFVIYLALLILFCLMFYRFVEAPLLESRPNYKREAEAHAL